MKSIKVKKKRATPNTPLFRLKNPKIREGGPYATAREHGLSATQREAQLRRRLRHLGLRLEKSRRRSGLRRVYCTWSIKDHNRVVMRLGTHLQVWALDLIEKWVDSHFE